MRHKLKLVKAEAPRPVTTIKFDMENLTPGEAAELLHVRIRAMMDGRVYVKAYTRESRGWGKLSPQQRISRKAKYAMKLTGSRAFAAEITGFKENLFKIRGISERRAINVTNPARG